MMHRTSSSTPAVYPVGAILTPTPSQCGQCRPMIPNTGGILYGTIMVGALLGAESARQQNYADTVGAVAIAMVLYWLVHAYTGYTERRVERGQPLTFGGLARTLAQELMILAGGVLPLLALLISWAAGASLSTAVNAGVYTSAA